MALLRRQETRAVPPISGQLSTGLLHSNARLLDAVMLRPTFIIAKGTSSRGPPRSGIVASGPTAYLRRFLRPDHPSGSRPVSQWSEMHRSPGLDRYRHLGLSFLKRLRSNRETVACARLSGRPEYWRATGVQILVSLPETRQAAGRGVQRTCNGFP